MGQLPSAKDTLVSDTTTSTTYEDVDGLTVQITTDNTSDILLLACIEARGSSTQKAGWRLVFDGTNYLDLERHVHAGAPANIMLTDLVPSKGAGTYTFKLQHKIALGTLTTLNTTIIAVSLHNGSGAVPAEVVYVASDTVGNAWEDIPFLTEDITLSATSHIVAIMVWNGYFSANNKAGLCLINIDGVDMEIHERDWESSNEYGCVSVVTRTATPLIAGTYTVKGRWKGAGGATLTGEDFKLVVFAAEADSGNATIDVQKVVVSSDTTTSTTLENIDLCTVTAELDETAHILGIMCLDTDVNTAPRSAYTTMRLYLTDQTVMRRMHASATRHGSVGQVVRTSSTLGAGSRTCWGRWYTDSGTTLAGQQIVMVTIVLAASVATVVVGNEDTYLYDIDTLAANEDTYLYDILNIIANEDTFLYDILTAIFNEDTYLYDIAALAINEDTFLYDIAALATNEDTLLYDILNVIANEDTFLYDIFFVLSMPARTLLYDIMVLAGNEDTYLYDIAALVANEDTLIYDILGLLTVGKEIILLYDLLTAIGNEDTFIYDILGIASKENTLLYDIAALVANERILLYDILTAIGNEDILLYDIAALIANEETLLYDIRNLVANENTLLYDILNSIANEETLRYDIFNIAGNEETLLYDIRNKIGKQLTLLYDLLLTLGKEQTLIYDLGLVVKLYTRIYSELSDLLTLIRTVNTDLDTIIWTEA